MSFVPYFADIIWGTGPLWLVCHCSWPTWGKMVHAEHGYLFSLQVAPEHTTPDPLSAAELLLGSIEPRLTYCPNKVLEDTPHGGAYSIREDSISVINRHLASSEHSLAEILVHEIIHCTGRAPTRLGRFAALPPGVASDEELMTVMREPCDFDDEPEERIAELGSFVVCAALGIAARHPAHPQWWLGNLAKHSPEAILKAASAANEAARFLLPKTDSLIWQ